MDPLGIKGTIGEVMLALALGMFLRFNSVIELGERTPPPSTLLPKTLAEGATTTVILLGDLSRLLFAPFWPPWNKLHARSLVSHVVRIKTTWIECYLSCIPITSFTGSFSLPTAVNIIFITKYQIYFFVYGNVLRSKLKDSHTTRATSTWTNLGIQMMITDEQLIIPVRDPVVVSTFTINISYWHCQPIKSFQLLYQASVRIPGWLGRRIIVQRSGCLHALPQRWVWYQLGYLCAPSDTKYIAVIAQKQIGKCS